MLYGVIDNTTRNESLWHKSKWMLLEKQHLESDNIDIHFLTLAVGIIDLIIPVLNEHSLNEHLH